VLSSRGLCDELITRPEESYWLWSRNLKNEGGHDPRWAAAPQGRGGGNKLNIMQAMQNVMVKGLKSPLTGREASFGNTLCLFGRLSTASVDILRQHQDVLRMVGMEAVETVSPLPTLVFPYSLHFWYTSSWNVMAHGDAREGSWRGKWRTECVASTLQTTSEHGVSSITTADAHTSAAGRRLNWRPRRFKCTRPFRRKTKFGFCACAITFQLDSTTKEGLRKNVLEEET